MGTGTSGILLSRRGLEFNYEFGRYPAAVFDVDALAHSRTSVVFRAFGALYARSGLAACCWR
jgi:hypothetical protein